VKTLKLSQASRSLADYATELGDEVLVVTDRNGPVAAIVPLKRADREDIALSNHPEFLGIIAQSRAEVRAGRTVSLEAMKRELLSKRSPNKPLQPTSRSTRKGSSRARRRAARG
jgi:antitoxin (DNA-binding transcriptional repressor) of toxin-antitoxin stability system